LDDTGAVSNQKKTDLSTGAFIVNPAPYLNILALVVADIFDVNPLHDF
jgi:hypothetical protein